MTGTSPEPFYQLYIYVPAAAAEPVKEACFAAGAGTLGPYDRCCWQSSGVGQFRPLEGSDPAIGRQGEEARVEELKIEMLCPADRLEAVAAALLDVHPYEVPAWGAFPVLTRISP